MQSNEPTRRSLTAQKPASTSSGSIGSIISSAAWIGLKSRVRLHAAGMSWPVYQTT